MKTMAALLVGLSATTTTHANTLDFSNFSCGVYDQKIHESSANPEAAKSIDVMHIWLYGYASGKYQSTSMSGPEATRFGMELGRQCHKSPRTSLAEAATSALRIVREET